MVRLAPGRAEVIDETVSGRLYLDGGILTPENGDALRERRHAAHNGVLHVALVLDRKGRLVSGPAVNAVGMPGDDENPLHEALEELADAAEDALKGLDHDAREDDDAVETAISRTVKKACYRLWGRRPIVESTVLRV
jgi:ribonuclease J